MLTIRFLRQGKKNQPFFQVVVTNKRTAPRGGKFIERLGYFNPLTKEVSLKKERIEYWLRQGAKCSDTVHNLLIKEKILKGKKIPVHKKPKAKEKTKEGGEKELTQKSEEHPKSQEKEEKKEEAAKPEDKIEKQPEVQEAKKEDKIEEREGEKKETEAVKKDEDTQNSQKRQEGDQEEQNETKSS